MKQSLARLRNLLIDRGYDQSLTDNFISYLDKMGDALIFPGSTALTIGTDPKTTSELFLVATAERIFNHFVVPKYNGSILYQYKVRGFDFPSDFEMNDPEDFEPIHKDEIEIISAYELLES